MLEGRRRVIIENIKPEIDCGEFPIKRVLGEEVVVEADIFSDGHDSISALLLYRKPVNGKWLEVPMRHLENDRWTGKFTVEEIGIYDYTVQGWIDNFRTWQNDIGKKFSAGQDIRVDIANGIKHITDAAANADADDRKTLLGFADYLRIETDFLKSVSCCLGEEVGILMKQYLKKRFVGTYDKELKVVVERPKASFSSWYEIFPRSCASDHGKHGTFADCEKILPDIAKMGFDVLYLPPIHPIGITKRKGKNNTLVAGPDDVGSPWAIGSEEGGHETIHRKLGTLEDFRRLIDNAKSYGIEVAMDLALQCSPDHPHVKEHPEWFRWRPDGNIQCAENPPKKYEDIVPLHFETDQWQDLWDELKSIVFFWIDRGIRIFRVDNPHTKPFAFWQWLIRHVKDKHPDIIFLSEAFTRPKIMYRLAKLGFSQSYTYFAWRNTKQEIIQYINELSSSEIREYFRPNFWPNTPDILPEHLQYGGRNAFMMRLVLAATLSSNFGIYGPAFELAVNEALPGTEEYLNSEKFEIKVWDRNREGNLKDFIARVNKIRKENPALQETYNIKHYEADNENIFCYGKTSRDLSNIILIAVNLDAYHKHSARVKIPLTELGIDPKQPYLVHDLLGDDKYIWQGELNYFEIDPYISPAFIFKIRKHMKKETDFDYFM